MIEIQAGNDLKTWEISQQGDLYRFRTDKYSVEKKTLHFPEMRCRYLKLLIYNHDDPPLKLAAFEAQGVEEDLVCRTQPGRSYSLYYGNAQAHAPRYDFERLKNYLSLETISRVRLGSQSKNDSFRPSGPKAALDGKTAGSLLGCSCLDGSRPWRLYCSLDDEGEDGMTQSDVVAVGAATCSGGGTRSS